MTPIKMSRQSKVDQLREYHQDTFNALGVPDAYFDSKAARMMVGENRIGFFESQLKKGVDIYFEINDFSQNIIDPERPLYKLKYDPHYTSNSKYEYVHDTPVGPQYYVMVKDLEVVEVDYENMSIEVIESIGDNEDSHMNELTARDHACILLKVPESTKVWLNDLINKSLKNK